MRPLLTALLLSAPALAEEPNNRHDTNPPGWHAVRPGGGGNEDWQPLRNDQSTRRVRNGDTPPRTQHGRFPLREKEMQ